MAFEKYINMPNAEIPADIKEKISSDGGITPTSFADKNDILYDKTLQNEVGFTRLDSGNYLVSMTCPMPKVTKEMVDWWFWWHPQEDERYKLWYPNEHFGVSYSEKDLPYFASEKMPEFKENTQYPIERIGKIKMPLSIEFKTPSNFGFDEKAMAENNVETIVCGHVGAFRSIVSHTEMAHIFFKANDGLFLVSRFWLGERLKNPLIRKAMLTDDTARGMAEHCCVEYRNFAKKIPMLYCEENK